MKKFIFLGLIATGIALCGAQSFADEAIPSLTEQQVKDKLLESYPEAEILASKLETEAGIPVYEFNIKTNAGEVLEVELDGNSGSIIEVEQADTDD